jgi:hypothetical protein
MQWPRLAQISRRVDKELLVRNEYLAAENQSQALPYRSSRSVVYGRVPGPAGREAGAASVKLPEQCQFERARGLIRTDDQGIVSGADEFVRPETGTSRRAAELLLPQGRLRITPT